MKKQEGSRRGKIQQNTKNPRLLGGENRNGAEKFDGARVLRPRSVLSLFNRQKTGKGQFILWILELC